MPWSSAVKAVVMPIIGALPALVLVVFAGLLGLLGLACGEGKRTYALAYAGHFTRLAAVLLGARQDPGADRVGVGGAAPAEEAPVDEPDPAIAVQDQEILTRA